MKVSDLMDDENKKKKKKVTVADLMEASQNPSSSSFASGVRERYKASTEITPTVSKLLAVENMQSRGAEPTLTHRDLGSIQTDLTAAKRERSGLLADTGFTPVDLGEFRAKLDSANQNVNRFESEKLIEDKVYQTQARADTFGGQFSANKTLGRLTQNQSRAWGEYVKNPTRENRKIAESYDKAIEDFARKNHIALDDENVKLGIISQSYANYIPQQVDQLKAQATGAVVGGLAGMVVGAPRVGVKVGASISSGMDMYEITRGAAFKRLTDLGVDEETARAMATDEGILQGLIESGDTYLDWTLFTGKALATKFLPSLTTKASSAAGKTALAKVINQLGGKVANLPTAVKVAGAYGINLPQEGLEEGMQEAVSIANDQRAKTGETGFWNLVGHSLDTGKTLLSGDDIIVGRDEKFMPIYASEQVKGAAKEGMKIAAVSGGMQAVAGYAAQRSLTPSTKSAKDVNAPTNPETKVPTPMSEASAPEVQQVQSQAEETKAQNPESTVLDSATTMYLNLAESKGKNTLKKAGIKADIVGRLIEGKKVEDGEINALNLTDAAYRNVFTQLTGVQFPNGSWSDPQVLRNLARSANKVAQQTRQEQQVQVQQAQERARTIQEQMDEAGYKVSPETQTRIDEANAQLASQVANIDVGPDGKPLANLSTFAQRYRAQVNKDASDADIKKAYTDFRNGSRTILFGGKRLKRDQFVQLFKDHGKNFSDRELDSMFNRAILDTLDGKDAYDRYVKKSDSGKDSDTLKLSNGGSITRKQYRAFLKELGAKSNMTVTDAHADRLFDQQKALEAQGKTQPYVQLMDKFMKEENTNGRREDLLNEGVHGRDSERAGKPTGSVQQEKRGTEASDGGGVEARNPSAGEVRAGENETAHRVGSGAKKKRSRSQKEAKALNIAPKKADIPTFKSWDDAFWYFEHSAGAETGFAFGDPPMMSDDMVFGSVRPWQPIKTYPKTQAGLEKFQSEVESIISGEAKTETTEAVPEFSGKSHIDSFAKKKKNAKKVTIDGHEYDAVSLRDYTGAMRRIRRQAKDVGFEIEFVFGDIKSEGHENALGLTIPRKRQIIVNVYDVNYLKTSRHELFHAYSYTNPGLHKRILDRVYDEDLGDVFDELYDKFAEDWSSYNDKNIDEWTLRFAIENEIFAEAFAKATDHSALIRKFVDIVREEVDPWLETWRPTKKDLSKKLSYPEFDTLVEWYGEELNGFSIEDLSDESMDFGEMYRFAPSAGDALTEYLKMVEETYGDELAQDMFDAFEDLDLSRRVAEAMANMEESVGAAPIGFDPHSHMMNEYGTLEPGENPSRDIDIAASTNGKDRVSQNVQTVVEAKATPESRLESIEDAVVDGKLSYIPIKNKVKARQASYELRAKGWDDALADWTAAVRSGQRSPELVAMGATLLNNAGNNPNCTGKQYINILTDYTELVHGTAQALQATRILKKLTPSGRLYGIERLTQNMNEARGIKPEDNVPVEEWMERTGELLAERLETAVGGSKSKAKTTAQIILKDLNAFARESFPEKEKATSRTEQDRLKDLFDNYDQYNEAWNAAKDTIREKYADKPEALAAFENWLEADLASSFLGRMLNAPEVHVNSQLADAYIHAKTEAERDGALDAILQDIANQIPSTLMEKFTALRYLNMLGNFKTVIRNSLGNVASIPARKMKDAIGAIIEGSLASMGKEVERTKSFTRDKATYLACKDDFEVVRDIILSGGKYNDATKYSNAIEEKRRIFKSKFFESYRTATKWAMDNSIFGDAGFSKIAYADAMARYLNANGATFESADAELLDKARAYAIQQAAEATYRDHNAFSDAIANMRFRNPQNIVEKGINTIGDGVLPFRRTPANILVRSIEYSPVGFITTAAEVIYGKKKGEYSATKLIDSLSKNATGSIIFMVGALALCEGLLKGKEPDEDKLANYEELLGHQFYAIELPNGMSLTLDWLAPSSIPLFLGAQFAEAAMRDGFSVRDIFEAATGVTDPLLQMSMLQGVNDALENASTYGDDGALVRFTGNALWSFMTQGLTNTFLGQVERSLSNQRSTTYADKNKDVPDGLQRLLGKTSAKIPGVDYNQIPYIDAWGRTEKNARTAAGNVLNQFFNPAYTSWVKESKMEKELRRLYEATGTAGVLPGRAKSYFNVDKKRKDLTAEEYVQYATTKGQTSYVVLADLTSGAQYKSMPDGIKEKAVVKAFDFANELAKAEVTGYTPDKWDKDPKEGQYVPEKWVMEAVENADKYGFSVADYVAVSTNLNEIESIKNADGDTISGSVSVQKAIAILELGLNDKQTKKLMEDFDVGEDYRKLTKKALEKKLKNMEKKAQQ